MTAPYHAPDSCLGGVPSGLEYVACRGGTRYVLHNHQALMRSTLCWWGKKPNATRNFSKIHGANEFTIIPQPIFVHCGIELINGLSIPYRGI